MLTELDITERTPNNPNSKLVPLVWVIDQQCLYDMPVLEGYAQMFLMCTAVEDVSNEYPNHNGIAVRFIRYAEPINDLLTSEYFGSILLSNPLVLNLLDYPYGRYVESPNAMFDGEKFITTNRDVSNLPPYYDDRSN